MVQFATAKIGAIMVNINPSYRTFELEYCLKQSEIKLLILQGRFKTSDYVGMFYEACPEAYESRPGRLMSEKFPFLKTIIFMGEIPYNGLYSCVITSYSIHYTKLYEIEQIPFVIKRTYYLSDCYINLSNP